MSMCEMLRVCLFASAFLGPCVCVLRFFSDFGICVDSNRFDLIFLILI